MPPVVRERTVEQEMPCMNNRIRKLNQDRRSMIAVQHGPRVHVFGSDQHCDEIRFSYVLNLVSTWFDVKNWLAQTIRMPKT
jgi:hypothetical protein